MIKFDISVVNFSVINIINLNDVFYWCENSRIKGLSFENCFWFV